MKRTNKPIRNFQKKKYYTNRTKGFGLLVKTKNTRNKNPQEPEWEYFYDPLKKEWGKRKPQALPKNYDK